SQLPCPTWVFAGWLARLSRLVDVASSAKQLRGRRPRSKVILLIHPPSGSAGWLTPSRRGRRYRTNPPRAVVPPGCGVHNGRATFESTTSADARVSAAVKETSRFSWATNVEAEQLEE